jgi:hypothetical protein
MHTAHIDILGLAESKLDSHKRNILTTCAEVARRLFSFFRIVMSSSVISYRNHYKQGGTALIAAGSITGRITTSFQDPMGRWSAIPLIGAQAQELIVTSAYQVCNTRQDRDTKARSMAAAAQQQAMIDISDPTSPMHAREKFRMDLLAFVQERQNEGHDTNALTKPIDQTQRGSCTLPQHVPLLTSFTSESEPPSLQLSEVDVNALITC